MDIPTAAQITAEALTTAPAKPHPRHYTEAIRILHEDKLMTWNEIAAWFTARGLAFSRAGIYDAYLNAQSAGLAAASLAAKKR